MSDYINLLACIPLLNHSVNMVQFRTRRPLQLSTARSKKNCVFKRNGNRTGLFINRHFSHLKTRGRSCSCSLLGKLLAEIFHRRLALTKLLAQLVLFPRRTVQRSHTVFVQPLQVLMLHLQRFVLLLPVCAAAQHSCRRNNCCHFENHPLFCLHTQPSFRFQCDVPISTRTSDSDNQLSNHGKV